MAPRSGVIVFVQGSNDYIVYARVLRKHGESELHVIP